MAAKPHCSLIPAPSVLSPLIYQLYQVFAKFLSESIPRVRPNFASFKISKGIIVSEYKDT